MSELSAAELMQKLAMSRAAQSAASASAALALAREVGTKRGAAYRPAVPSSRESIMSPSGASVAGNDEAYVVPRARLNAMMRVKTSSSRTPRVVAGFNSFMGDAMGGWVEELTSAKFRQAILAEFVATGEDRAKRSEAKRSAGIASRARLLAHHSLVRASLACSRNANTLPPQASSSRQASCQ